MIEPVPDLRWLAWKLDPNSSKLNTPLIFELNGPLNIQALSKAVSAYINEFHQSARCYFYEHDNVVERRFLDPIPVEIEFIHNKNPKEHDIDLTIQNFCRQPFDLSHPPLFKFGLLILPEQNYIFMVNFHHIISDAFTGKYVVEKLGKLYNHFASGAPYPKSISALYENCERQEKTSYTLQQKEADLVFWEEKLKNVPLTVDFSLKNFFEKQHLIKKTDEANSRHFSLDEKTTLALKQTARKLGTTPFIMLSALYALILSRYTNQKYIVLSYSVNTRPPGYLDMPGCFVNEVPFVFDFSNTQTYEQLFKVSTLERKAAKPHQRCLKNTYFNVSIHEAFLNPHPLDLTGVSVSCKQTVTHSLYNDLALFFQLTERLEFRLDYRIASFDLLLIDQFVSHFTDALKKSLYNPVADINQENIVFYNPVKRQNFLLKYALEFKKRLFKASEKQAAVSSVIFDIFEVQLQTLWCELLGIAHVDINDNFFDVGGKSLLAIHLVSLVNEKFNVQYSVPWIFENNTIKSQAYQLRKNNNITAPYNPIISFNNGGHKPPLFLVHPGLAGAEAYSELAKHLDKNIPLYAIDSYNLNSEKSFLSTIEALAEKYIEYTQSVKPKGPYLLGGWSLGGIIAYEMAQQLTRCGEEVQAIYLLDSQLYSSAYLDLIHAGITVKGLISTLPRDRGQYIASLPPRYLERVIASLKNDAKILKNYVVTPYAGKVCLIKTTQKTKLNRGLIENPYKRWQKNIKNLELIPIDANHFNLVEGEQVKKVADLINESQ